jgi:3D (Asp-Asp-Asp) domain-containing protein
MRLRVVWALVAVLAGFLVLALLDDAEAATAYCLRGTMADGTYTRPGSAAHNGFALGTKITVRPAPWWHPSGQFVVRDRIGYGTDLDLWAPDCGTAILYGRRSVSVQVGWWHKRGRVKPRRVEAVPKRWLP